MAVHKLAPGSGLEGARALPPALVPLDPVNEDLAPIGEALKTRTEDVLRDTRERTYDPGLDTLVQESFERICTSSTIAVARLISGEGLDVAREAGRETWEIFGELAAHRAASLGLVTKRCLWWRNVMVEVIQDIALQLDSSPLALSQALSLLQMSLEFSLLRMSESFEAERQRVDEELARREEELGFLATHDALTGLPNRTLILDRIEQMLARCERRKSPVAALFVDLDNFKSINDTLGHSTGDELLRAVAERLEGVVRGADALGRLGGDEFVVISEEVSRGVGPELLAERLLEAFKQPFKLGANKQTRLLVTPSIGIALGERTTAEELLREADIAMYRAKWDGKNRYVIFETPMQDKIRHRMELEMDLRDALAKGEFFLAYQPTFALGNMSPTGVEALIRWKHPVRGVVQPDDFIPLVEETGLIHEIGKWVLDEACMQGAAWRNDGHPIGVAVNVSARQLDSDQLLSDLEGALARSGLDPGALTIEITETTLMRNVGETARRLIAVKDLGVRIAIDDFGTGYSSFGHLKQFPVDALKIDQSFIAGLSDNHEADTIIHTLVQLGKALSIETFAEGIERPQQLSLLQDEDCDSGQGFLFARPLDVPSTEAFLERWVKDGGVYSS
jgi:diguanylate cyclase (GGDEF)-like protein